MFDRFANDPLVRLLRPEEELEQIKGRVEELNRREAIASQEYAREIFQIRLEREDLLRQLEEANAHWREAQTKW